MRYMSGSSSMALRARAMRTLQFMTSSHGIGYRMKVVQVYGVCIRTLRLPVISVMIIGVMRFSYNDRAVLDGRFRHHLFQAVFMQTTYPSRYVYFRWSKVHTAVETAVSAPVSV